MLMSRQQRQQQKKPAEHQQTFETYRTRGGGGGHPLRTHESEQQQPRADVYVSTGPVRLARLTPEQALRGAR